MNTKEKKGFWRIGMMYLRGAKASRDRYSGTMRYFAEHGDKHVLLIDITDPSIWQKPNDAPILDGCIEVPHTAVTSRLLTPNIPIVHFYNARMEWPKNEICIPIDNAAVATVLAELFLKRGYRNFAYVGKRHTAMSGTMKPLSESENLNSLERQEAFRARVAKEGCECAVFNMDASRLFASLQSLADFLSTLPPPCAVMAYNDRTAQNVYNACRMAKLSIPDRIAIAGVDNETETCEMLRPTLTSVLPDFEMSGYLAAEMLMRRLEAPHSRIPDVTYGVRHVFERESSQDIDGTKRLAWLARAHIAANGLGRLGVGDVAHALGVSRRTLETRFRNATGSTVREAIERERLETAKRLLTTTSRRIEDIATSCGMSSAKQFRKVFVRACGMAPTTFRNQHGHFASFPF